jgi:hypothetical protein
VLGFEADRVEHRRLLRNIAANATLIPAPEARLARVTAGARPNDVTLDGVAFDTTAFVPDVVKLDIEGWELYALEGATRLLSERRPHLIVETHSDTLEHDCVALLRSHGYAPPGSSTHGRLAEVRAGHNRWLVAEGEARETETPPKRALSSRTRVECGTPSSLC